MYSEQFINFVEDLCGQSGNAALCEAIKSGYSVCCEAKNKKAKLSNHGAQRRVERGLRQCDVAKILKFGEWSPIEDGKFKVSLDKDLYLIVAPDQKTVVTVVNNRRLDSDGIYKLIGDIARDSVRNHTERITNEINRTGHLRSAGGLTNPVSDTGFNRAARRGYVKRLAKDMLGDSSTPELLSSYSSLCDDWTIR